LAVQHSRGDKLGKQSYIAGRVLLDWDNSNGVRLSLNVNGWRDTSDPQAATDRHTSDISAFTPASVLTAPFAPANARAADWTASLDPATGRSIQRQEQSRRGRLNR
jgi:hypothetical protein